MKTSFSDRLFHVAFLFLLIALVLSAGCSSSSGSDTPTGDVTIGLTDARGDFATYSVDVVSVTLTHANGTVVETLPFTTRVDFAQYVDLTEFLTAASVPLGAYKKATLTLDYSDADIHVENSEGEPQAVSTLVDENGAPVTLIDMEVYLENQSALVVSPGQLSHVTLDFDLKASNSVSFDGEGNASVVVEPSLMVYVNHASRKPFRVRGNLSEVHADMGNFSVKLRPFYHRLSDALDEFGELLVLSDENTLYEINGESAVGQTGLEALAELDAGVAVVVKGKMTFNPCRFEASQVLAGTSVPGEDSDYITGSILSRDNNTLTVNGMVYVKDEDRLIMNETVVVTIGEETQVSRPMLDDEVTIDNLSPGQHVTIAGELSINEILPPELDATSGLVRMDRTVLRAKVSEDPESDFFTINLDSISMRPVDLFDFQGTGLTAETDADPSSYEVDAASLSTTGFAEGDFVKIFGFTQVFGQAPYDFMATSLVNFDDFVSFIKLRWVPSTTEPFTSISANELVVNLEGTHLFHHLGRCGVVMNLENLATTPAIIPSDQGTYVIMLKKKPMVYGDFTEFVQALDLYLDGKQRAKKLFVAGTYEASTSTLKAQYLTLFLQ